MRLREHFSRLKVKETSESPTPSAMAANENIQVSPNGEAVLSTLLEIDRRAEKDVLAMLLPRASMLQKPRRRRKTVKPVPSLI
jgi:hypothetical protein